MKYKLVTHSHPTPVEALEQRATPLKVSLHNITVLISCALSSPLTFMSRVNKVIQYRELLSSIYISWRDDVTNKNLYAGLPKLPDKLT